MLVFVAVGLQIRPNRYSAVAWHFAKNLSHALGVPVGIVSAAYGGTRVESWMNKRLLEAHVKLFM
ncbi:MAG: hypothetical protein IKP99_04930 [Bacteroidales bacterium]|nr:hypothetical protein [Bacteroidales bacterium]